MKNLNKKWLAGVLAAAVLLFSLPLTASALTPEEQKIADLEADVEYLQQQLQKLQNKPEPTSTPTPVYAPMVKLLSPQTVTMKNNEAVEIDVVLKNIGNSTAMSVLTQASYEGPFTIEFLNNSNNVGSISEGGTRTIKMRITSSKNAEAGTYTVTLNHAFRSRDAENKAETDSLTVRIESTAFAPNVMLRDFTTDKTGATDATGATGATGAANLRPGESFTVTAVMQNTGEGEAFEAQIGLEGLDAEKVYLTSDPNAAYRQTLPAQASELIQFRFTTAAKAKSGTYPLTFKLSYKDEAGEVKENTYTYYVNVTSTETDDRAVVELTGLTAPGGSTEVGGSAVVTMQIQNTGALTAKNIKITAVSSDETAVVPKSANIKMINSLEAGGSQSASFTFSPTADAKTQNYVIAFNVEYETGRELSDDVMETVTFSQYAGINVFNPDETESDEKLKFSKPKMIVSEYAVDPNIVRAGREFDLMLTFQNASALKEVNNIKITLVAVETTEKKGSVFTPVGGSNTFYIDSIGPKGTVDKTLRMYTVPDADPRTYNIAVQFNYQDSDFNEYDEQEQISINVKQITRLETDPINFPSDSPVYQPVYLYFSVLNTGKVSLSNVRVRIEGNFDTTNISPYLGNIAKGNSVYFEGNFTPQETGQQRGTLYVSGEDDTGEIIEISQDFVINVMDAGGFDDPWGGDRPMPEEMNGEMSGEQNSIAATLLKFVLNPIVWGVTGAIVVVVIIVIVVVVRGRKKRIDFDE